MEKIKLKVNPLPIFIVAVSIFASCSSSNTITSYEDYLVTSSPSSNSSQNKIAFISSLSNFNSTEKINAIFFIYIAGDNNLSNFINSDIKEVKNASKKNPKIAYFLFIDDKSNESKVKLILNGTSYLIKAFEEIDSGNYKTLESMAEFVKIYSLNNLRVSESLWNNIPFYLVIWNHGDAWTYYPKTKLRAIADDETSKSKININELVRALRYINNNIHKINLLGFDACLMGNIETLYSIFVNNITNYIVASEFYEPAHGWNYDISFENISNPYLTGKNIVNAYAYYYEKVAPGSYSLALYEKNNTLSYINYIDKIALKLINNKPNSFDIVKDHALNYKVDDYYSYLIDSYLLFNNTAKDLGFSFNYTNFPTYFKTNLKNIKGATIGFPTYNFDLEQFDYYTNPIINPFASTNYGIFIKDYIDYIK